MGEHIGDKDNGEKFGLSPTSAIRKLAFDRIVLAHFFVLFLISFAIGVLFLHSMFTFSWDSESSESLEKVLQDLGVDQIKAAVSIEYFNTDNSHMLALKIENKTFMSKNVYSR